VSQLRSRRDELFSAGLRARDELALRRIRLIGAHEPAFPESLRGVPDGPLWLFVEGEPKVLHDPSLVAIVGTRQPSPGGVAAARRLAGLVVKDGFGLVSGLAEGIDAAAHGAAAKLKAPQVAVLGTGINLVFPASTASLRRRIVESGGAVVTEYLPNERYDRLRFVERNRIQAGLAVAVCPVESRERSGTAHTLRFAVKYGRPLFGVRRGEAAPGNEMLAVLAGQGAPIFDLVTESGVAELRRFLERLPGTRGPAPTLAPPEDLFREPLDALQEVITDIPLSEKEGEWFMEQAARRLNILYPPPGRAGGR
jgi:DNA protecting protein DprA